MSGFNLVLPTKCGRIKLLHPGDDPEHRFQHEKCPVSYSYPGDHTFHVMQKIFENSGCFNGSQFQSSSIFTFRNDSPRWGSLLTTVPPSFPLRSQCQLVSEGATTCIERVRYRIGALVELEPKHWAQKCSGSAHWDCLECLENHVFCENHCDVTPQNATNYIKLCWG
jgi:hypothetical protein